VAIAAAAGPRGAPRARGLPLLGSTLSLARDPIEFLVDQHQRLGPIFRIRAAHLRLSVLAGERANDFAHRDGAAFFSNREVWGPTLAEFGAPNNFVGLDGEPHALLRKTFAPWFSKRAAEAHLEALVRSAVDAFRDLAPGGAIPFVAFSQALTSRQVGAILCGRVPTAEEHAAILRYTNSVLVNLSLRRLPPWLLRLKGRRFRNDRRLAFGFAERAVREHLADPGRTPNFIDAVEKAAEEHPDLFDEGEVLSSGLLPFFAGVDTVGQTNVFALYELLRHPELLARVRDEVDALFAAGVPSAPALRGAQDLSGAVNEALRLHPVAFAMPRNAAERFSFAGHDVERGESLLVFTSACHFLPEYFPEPRRFDIDRHRPPRDEHRRPNVFAPFGRGPHHCLGAGFAGVQLAATLATILHHCDLELADPDAHQPTVLAPSLSLGPKFRIRFKGWRNPPAERVDGADPQSRRTPRSHG